MLQKDAIPDKEPLLRVGIVLPEDQAKHIKGGQARGNCADYPKGHVTLGTAECLPEYFILAEKTGKAGYAGYGQRSYEHGVESNRCFIFQPSNVAHVLLAAQGMNNASRAEKQKCLEEGVGQNMKHAGCKGTDS